MQCQLQLRALSKIEIDLRSHEHYRREISRITMACAGLGGLGRYAGGIPTASRRRAHDVPMRCRSTTDGLETYKNDSKIINYQFTIFLRPFYVNSTTPTHPIRRLPDLWFSPSLLPAASLLYPLFYLVYFCSHGTKYTKEAWSRAHRSGQAKVFWRLHFILSFDQQHGAPCRH